MKSAQITVYLTLSFTLILSMFLTVFEAARGNYMKLKIENAVQTAIHSSFAEYHQELFERYGLLFIDTSYMTREPDYHKLEDRIGEYLEYNISPEKDALLLLARDWFDLQEYNVCLTNIRLATDDRGRVMKQQAVDYMQNYVGGDWIEQIQSWIGVVEEYEISAEGFEEYYKDILTQGEEQWGENYLLEEDWSSDVGLPSLDFHETYIEPFFEQLPDTNIWGVSTKLINPLNHASYRQNIEGTEVLEDAEIDMTQELFFGEYILCKFGNYRDIKEDCKLDYQVEYILFGLPQDAMNFLCMLELLFTFRCAANLTMLLTDSETQQMIETVSSLAAFVEIPPELVSAIINVCWAAAESMDDVEKIVDGDKVELLKKPKDFSVSIGSLITGISFDFLEEETDQTEFSISLGYEDYLRLFLYMTPPVFKTFRCMDMMEADIRLTEGNEYFRMDGCTDAVSLEIGISSGYDYFYSLKRKYGYY